MKAEGEGMVREREFVKMRSQGVCELDLANQWKKSKRNYVEKILFHSSHNENGG